MIKAVLNSYRLHLDFLQRLVADLSIEDMVVQPKSVPNHAAWTIGHLVHSSQTIGGQLGLSPWLLEEWGERFGTASLPIANVEAYPGKQILLNALEDGHARISQRLHEMDETELSAPLPDLRYRDQFPTIGHAVIHILAGHTALHVGQLTIWRRATCLTEMPELLNHQAQ